MTLSAENKALVERYAFEPEYAVRHGLLRDTIDLETLLNAAREEGRQQRKSVQD